MSEGTGTLAVAAGALAASCAGAGTMAFALRADHQIHTRVASLCRRPGSGEPASPLRRLLMRVAQSGLIERRAVPSDVELTLAAAGSSLSPPELGALQLLSAAGIVIVGAAVCWMAGGSWPLLPFFAVAGYRGPRIFLARAARRRRARADRELPQFLDLLAAASTAGLGPHGALIRATAATSGPLEQELRRFLGEVELGARWRDGLLRLADRMGLPDLRHAVQAMIRTERLGSSLAEALRELADDVREDRRSAAAERARKAPVKMLFPLVFMILPAFLLLTVVPVLISTLRSIR